MIIRFLIALILIATAVAPKNASAENLDAYYQLASFCEADGCSHLNFFPMIDPATGQINQSSFVFGVNDGKCLDFTDPNPDDKITLMVILEDGADIRVNSFSGPGSSIKDVCRAVIQIKEYPFEISTRACSAQACGNYELVHNALRYGVRYFEGKAPDGAVIVGWTSDDNLVVLHPGSRADGTGLEYSVQFWTDF